MNLIKSLIIGLIIFFCASLSWAAGSSVTQSGTGYGFQELHNAYGPTNSSSLTLLLTSDNATGAVSADISQANMDLIMGRYIMQVDCYPDGTDTPSDQYDITITTKSPAGAAGYDIMGGTLANRTNATTGDTAMPYIGGLAYGPRQIVSNLTINGAAMGNSKKTVCVIGLSR